MRGYDDDDDDGDLSRAIDDLCGLLSAVFRGPQRKASSGGGGAPPPLAGLAWLLLGASLTLVIGGSLSLLIGVVLLPVVVAVILLAYLPGIFFTISEMGRGTIFPSNMLHKHACLNFEGIVEYKRSKFKLPNMGWKYEDM